MRLSGTVKKFIDSRPDGEHRGTGFGFILPDGEQGEVFVHRTQLGHSCFRDTQSGTRHVLFQGERVSFEVFEDPPGRRKAKDVELI